MRRSKYVVSGRQHTVVESKTFKKTQVPHILKLLVKTHYKNIKENLFKIIVLMVVALE
jgi:hypothetical protein